MALVPLVLLGALPADETLASLAIHLQGLLEMESAQLRRQWLQERGYHPRRMPLVSSLLVDHLEAVAAEGHLAVETLFEGRLFGTSVAR